jgi:hypothetical protein
MISQPLSAHPPLPSRQGFLLLAIFYQEKDRKSALLTTREQAIETGLNNSNHQRQYATTATAKPCCRNGFASRSTP